MIGAAQFQYVRSAPVATAAATFPAAAARHAAIAKALHANGVQAGRLGIRAHPLACAKRTRER